MDAAEGRLMTWMDGKRYDYTRIRRDILSYRSWKMQSDITKILYYLSNLEPLFHQDLCPQAQDNLLTRYDRPRAHKGVDARRT